MICALAKLGEQWPQSVRQQRVKDGRAVPDHQPSAGLYFAKW